MKLRYDPRALADLNDIHEFIARADADAAKRAILRIERAINRLMRLMTAPWSGVKVPFQERGCSLFRAFLMLLFTRLRTMSSRLSPSCIHVVSDGTETV